MSEIEIRPVQTFEDVVQIENLQDEVWGTPHRIFRARHMHALQQNGAILLGAYDGERVVGFVLAVIGLIDSPSRVDQIAAARLKLYSNMMAVHPDYQGAGIGYRLKVAQREAANRIGVRLITWTYDPLLGRNGWLNFNKLGGICDTYYPAYYGELGGLSEDRLVVEWWVTGNRAKGKVEQSQHNSLSLHAYLDGGAQRINTTTINADGWLVPEPNYAAKGARFALLEIPADFEAIRREDIELAQLWRLHVREILTYAFDNGYLITEMVRHTEANGRPRSFYLLTHEGGQSMRG